MRYQHCFGSARSHFHTTLTVGLDMPAALSGYSPLLQPESLHGPWLTTDIESIALQRKTVTLWLLSVKNAVTLFALAPARLIVTL